MDDAFQHFRGAGVIPDAFGIDEGDRPAHANTQAIRFRAVNERLRSDQVQLGEPALQKFPGGQGFFARTAFGIGRVGAEKNMAAEFFHTKLFHGGQAFLRLTDAENQAESGLEIVASPPGKKLQNVLLLSGGEKALTALSLLVGIFQYQPAPFCVLDEVDAALDETNVGRLADLLHGMSQDTQFLLVTHSKRMMQTADMIYGVTMQEPGVSKIVSVHLGNQQQDRGRERATA